jgi:hypothetical protein
MRLIHSRAQRFIVLVLTLCAGSALSFSSVQAQPVLVVKPVAEKKVAQLPAGPLYWRVETFPTLAAAQAAAGPTSLAAEVSGKAWLMTLGAKGGATPGGSVAAEIGPVPPVSAKEYLLRINHAYGPPGAKTPVHTHPGSEAFYVLTGRLGQKTLHGVDYVDAGQTLNGHVGDMPMQVFNGGTTDLDQLVMFVVDAGRDFSVPSKFE